MNNEQLHREIYSASCAINELVKLSIKSNCPDPIVSMEHTKAALIHLKAVYHAIEKQLNIVTV